MPIKKNKDLQDEQFDFNHAPRRKQYKKIALQVKKSLINDFFVENIEIPQLTRKYHLTYSTIAHILKVYKEKQRIFESRRAFNQRQQRDLTDLTAKILKNKKQGKQKTLSNQNDHREPENNFYVLPPAYFYIIY